MLHKQTEFFFKAGNTIPAGAFWCLGGFSARGLTAHFISCRSCTIPSATSTCVWQSGTISCPGLPKGSLTISLSPAPLLPALCVPLQHLWSQSTETLTLSAAVHSSNKDAIINWLRARPQIQCTASLQDSLNTAHAVLKLWIPALMPEF